MLECRNLRQPDGCHFSFSGGALMGIRIEEHRVIPQVENGTADRVFRDVTLTLEHVPLWAVDALFRRVHLELGKPNVGEVEANLIIEYVGLDETEFALLTELADRLWVYPNVVLTQELTKKVTP